jgi:hypothetical protein
MQQRIPPKEMPQWNAWMHQPQPPRARIRIGPGPSVGAMLTMRAALQARRRREEAAARSASG